jgi:hypothetical protein
LLCLFVVTGCVIPPPIITVVEEEYPPFISSEFVSPADQIVLATTDDPITLSLNALFDQNPEAQLYVAWYSQNDGVISSTTVQLETQGDEPDAFNIFYTYGGVEVEIDPCNPAYANAQSDIVWAYVSDEPWVLLDNALGVKERPGAFKTSYSWVIEFNVLCTDF